MLNTKRAVSIGLTMITIVSLGGCKENEASIENYNTEIIAKTVEYDEEGNENIWEVHKNLDSSTEKECYIVNNGEIVQTTNIDSAEESIKIMEEPHLDEIGSIDISGNEQIAYNTWQTEIEEAYGYVKHFIENENYRLWFKGISSNYSEIYLIKKGAGGEEINAEQKNVEDKAEEVETSSDVKRIIITDDTISIGENIDINDSKFKLNDVAEYIGGN